MPQAGNPSGDETVDGLVDESLSYDECALQKFTLDSDAQKVITLDPMISVRVIKIKVSGGPVVMALSSAAGTDQAVPVDGFGLIISAGTPFTGIKLTRTAGKTTQVRLFLGA